MNKFTVNYILFGNFEVINLKRLILLLILSVLFVVKAFAEDLEEFEEFEELYGGEEIISLATGSAQPISKAPAVATVITANEIREIGARYGTFNTKESWLLHGGNYAGFDVAFMAEVKSTDGHHEDIDSDFQTFSDSLPFTMTSASLAPGSTNNGRDNIDLRLDIEKQQWQLRAGLQQRRNIEPGVGTGGALDNSLQFEGERWNVDLTFDDEEFTENWGLQAQVSYFSSSLEIDDDQIVFPPGAFLLNPTTVGPPAFGPFPDGVIGNPEYWVETYRYSLTGLYHGFNDHMIRVGVGYTDQEFTRVREENNFCMSCMGMVTDVSDTSDVFLPEKHRDNSFAFVQDVWGFANDWELTLGLRYDDYNDFGDTWNPRAALVWSARHDTTLKLLYGQAFRAPSFAEFRNQNNPIAQGNSELDPEEIETIELAIDYRPNDELKLGANVFYYEWKDIIDFVTEPSGLATAQNTGRQEGHGFELEMEWQPNSNFSLLANYALQDSEDKSTNEDSGNAPHHQLYARADWEFKPGWHITPAVNYVIDRDRPPGDARDELDDYAVFDLTLRSKAFSNKWEAAIGARNLFNSSPEEPTDAGLNISNDLPLERRTVFAEFRINFE